MAQQRTFRIAIIGGGPTGLAAGRELLQQGFHEFTLFEASDAVGGTWHVQTYPGLACDVWAHSYTFACAPNPDWSASFVEQPEIEAYLQHCATQFGLDAHIRCNCTISSARYQAGGSWLLTTDSGEELEFDAVINAMGNQFTPAWPQLPGMADFGGESWHSTRWNHAVDLRGKRIAIVGSAASAVQIVPELAKIAGHLYVLQRTPNWLLPRGKKPYGEFSKKLFHRFPGLTRLLRKGQGMLMSMMHQGALLGHKRMAMFEKMGRQHIAKTIADPALREALTPDTRFGCKRPLVSDDFYPALCRDNVSLKPCAAQAVTATGLITAQGEAIDVEVIIYCTGYKVMDFERMQVIGENGQSLADNMAQAPQGFRGVALPGFPNYFTGAGPNGTVLSVSFFKSIEANVAYIVRLLAELRERQGNEIRVKPDLHRQYNDWLQSQFGLFSWGEAACTSYYTAGGHHPFLFPGDYKTFIAQQRDSGLHEYEVR